MQTSSLSLLNFLTLWPTYIVLFGFLVFFHDLIFPMHLDSWPQFDSEQIRAASGVLVSGKVNSWTGDQTKAFEREFAHGAVLLMRLR